MASLRDYIENLLSNGHIRHTNETPKRIYVYDFIQYMTNVADPKRAYARICQRDPQVPLMVDMYSMDRLCPVPVTNIRGMYLIANWCRGVKAGEFRSIVASMMARYYGGDVSLVDEVRSNAQNSTVVEQFM
jgi:hypothetical protein